MPEVGESPVVPAGLFAVKKAWCLGTITSFNCYEYTVEVQIGSLELELEVPYDSVELPPDVNALEPGDTVRVRFR